MCCFCVAVTTSNASKTTSSSSGGSARSPKRERTSPSSSPSSLFPTALPASTMHLEVPKLSPTAPHLAAASFYGGHPLPATVVRQTSPLLQGGPLWGAAGAQSLFSQLPPSLALGAGVTAAVTAAAVAEANDAPLNLSRPKKEVKAERGGELDLHALYGEKVKRESGVGGVTPPPAHGGSSNSHHHHQHHSSSLHSSSSSSHRLHHNSSSSSTATNSSSLSRDRDSRGSRPPTTTLPSPVLPVSVAVSQSMGHAGASPEVRMERIIVFPQQTQPENKRCTCV